MLADMPKIYWAGDSTVKQNDFTSYPQCGIGQGFQLFVKKEILIVNRAENGRSTKSFIDEGRLEFIKENIKKGDFLFIQFGHNDEKEQDPDRYTEAGTTFKENLKIYIDAARSVGAYPLLITPLYRRRFTEDGSLEENTHLGYPAAMIEVGAECNVPVIDLCTKSEKLIKKTGDMDSRKWFMYFDAGMYPNYPEGKADNTHLRYEGAVEFARIIASEITKLDKVYTDILVSSEDVKEAAYLLVD